jgi:cell division control protein 6
LNCQTLEFNSYNTAQLEQILEKRVEQAFRPGSVPGEVITEIAEQVAENSGDCREALRLLLRSGRAAENSGEDKLTVDSLQYS